MKLRIGALAVVLVLPLALASTTSAAQPDSTPYYWQVPGGDERVLVDAGFDVERGVGGPVQVVGDARVADRLAGLGYQPVKVDTVYKPVVVSPCQHFFCGRCVVTSSGIPTRIITSCYCSCIVLGFV